MELEGKLIVKLDPITGEGRNGPWKKQSFVIETLDNYPKKVCFTIWGDRVPLNNFTESDTIRVSFDAESREYNGNWYTDLKCWKIELSSPGNVGKPPMETPPFNADDAPFELDSDPGDDLPF